MLYRISARFIENKMPAFHEILTNGTVRNQKPDGEEIVAAMRRAIITAPGVIEWYETCYCPEPLQHERATVFDHYMTKITAQPAREVEEIEGEAFWPYLERVTKDRVG